MSQGTLEGLQPLGLGQLADDTDLSLIYGLFYLFFESFPLIFVEVHGFTASQLGLSFIGVLIGAFLAVSML